jgi:hypothetical protein
MSFECKDKEFKDNHKEILYIINKEDKENSQNLSNKIINIMTHPLNNNYNYEFYKLSIEDKNKEKIEIKDNITPESLSHLSENIKNEKKLIPKLEEFLIEISNDNSKINTNDNINNTNSNHTKYHNNSDMNIVKFLNKPRKEIEKKVTISLYLNKKYLNKKFFEKFIEKNDLNNIRNSEILKDFCIFKIDLLINEETQTYQMIDLSVSKFNELFKNEEIEYRLNSYYEEYNIRPSALEEDIILYNKNLLEDSQLIRFCLKYFHHPYGKKFCSYDLIYDEQYSLKPYSRNKCANFCEIL